MIGKTKSILFQSKIYLFGAAPRFVYKFPERNSGAAAAGRKDALNIIDRTRAMERHKRMQQGTDAHRSIAADHCKPCKGVTKRQSHKLKNSWYHAGVHRETGSKEMVMKGEKREKGGKHSTTQSHLQ